MRRQSQRDKLANVKLRRLLKQASSSFYGQKRLDDQLGLYGTNQQRAEEQNSTGQTSYHTAFQPCIGENVSGRLLLPNFPSVGPLCFLYPSLSSSLTINHNLVISNSHSNQTHIYTQSLITNHYSLVIKKDLRKSLVPKRTLVKTWSITLIS